MKLYLSNGITVTVGSQGEVSHEPVTTHIKPNGDVTVLMYPSRNAIIPPTHYSLIFKADGTTPIGTDFATAQAYLIANTVFKTAAGGSVALVRGFKQRVEADGGIFEAEDCLYSSAKINSKLYKEASLIVTPNAYAENKLYALKPSDGSGDLTWSRAGTKTRVNPSGLVESLPYNLLANSEGNVSTLSSSGLVTNAAVSISGFLNSIQIPISGTAYAYRQYTCNIGSTYTVSMFIEMDDGSVPVFGTSPTTGNFRLVIASDPAGSLPIVEHISGNLYKISATYTALVAGANNGIIRYSGQVLKTFRVSGMQLVLGSISKPYLRTTDRLNVPSIDFIGGGCPSILVEPQRTNLVLQSNNLASAPWIGIKAGTGLLPVVTSNYLDGSLNVNKVVLDRGVGNTTGDYSWHYIGLTTTSVVHTLSFKIKAFAAGDIGKQVFVRCVGANISQTITLTADYQTISFISTSTPTGSATAVDFYNRGAATTGNSVSYLIYNVQLEAGAYATSYIPTVASAVTRVVDVARKIGASSLIGQTSGAFIINAKLTYGSVANTTYFSISDGTANNQIRIIRGASANSIRVIFQLNGGIIQFDINNLLIDFNANHKIGVIYSSGFIKVSIDGVTVASSTNTITLSAPLSVIGLCNPLGVLDHPEPLRFNDFEIINGLITESQLNQYTTL